MRQGKRSVIKHYTNQVFIAFIIAKRVYCLSHGQAMEMLRKNRNEGKS
jgi:hypothetical protein